MSYSLRKNSLIYLTTATCLLCSPAIADQITHKLRVVSAKTVAWDCPNNSRNCGSWACVMKADLENIGEKKSPEFDVLLSFKHPKDPYGDGRKVKFSFQFPTAEHGMSVTARGDALGVTCRQILVDGIQAECIGGDPNMCTGNFSIQAYDRKAPKINNTVVDVH